MSLHLREDESFEIEMRLKERFGTKKHISKIQQISKINSMIEMNNFRIGSRHIMSIM